jgi:hypothetical protein
MVEEIAKLRQEANLKDAIVHNLNYELNVVRLTSLNF